MLTNLKAKRREKNTPKAFMENDYSNNAAVMELVDIPDLGSPHSFNNSSDSSPVTLCQPTNVNLWSLESLCN